MSCFIRFLSVQIFQVRNQFVFVRNLPELQNDKLFLVKRNPKFVRFPPDCIRNKKWNPKFIRFLPNCIRNKNRDPKSVRTCPEFVRSIKSDKIFCKVESEIHLFSSGLYPQQALESEISPHLSGISPDYKI